MAQEFATYLSSEVTVRINFEANPALVELIDSLATRAGSTKKGVIVGALQFLKWSLDQKDQGFVTVAISPDGLKRREFQNQIMIASTNALPPHPSRKR
ncbi:MAG: hypothetical protein JWN50_285 [Parcubacteria group bacterium]|nr:hypothetical protein [Parcubacteria group bacterium]